MAKFSPGDKVAFIHDKLSGVVKQISGRGEVLVTLDDGFEIPVDVRELVLVESGDKSSETQETKEEKFVSPRAELQDKIAIGFVVEGSSVKAYLLNNSSQLVLYLIYNITSSPELVGQGSLEKATSVFLAAFPLSDSAKWRQWRVQLLQHQSGKADVLSPIDYTVKVRDASLIKETAEIPFLGKKGLLVEIPLKQENRVGVVPDDQVSEGSESHVEPVGEVIDLHANDVTPSDSIMAESILRSQLSLIQNSVEKAVAQGMEQITFIHGVGNGTLKLEMQKILMRHRDVKRWEEADVKKFGYGATAVYLKTH